LRTPSTRCFRSEGVEVIRTPIRAPRANAYAERLVGPLRRECLDWILILGRSQLERVLHIYVEHYNGHRPHRGLGLVPPQPRCALGLVALGIRNVSTGGINSAD
jgi:transposase InsO family protein